MLKRMRNKLLPMGKCDCESNVRGKYVLTIQVKENFNYRQI